MSKYLSPEIEPNKLGLKLKNRPQFDEMEESFDLNKESVFDEIIPPENSIEFSKEESIKQTTNEDINIEPIPKKPTSKILQLMDFILLSGIIFVIIFLVINFSAYKLIIINYVFPEQQIEKTKDLNNAVGQKPVKQILASVDNSKKHIKKLFPVLDLTIAPPDNRLIIPKIGKNIPIVEMDVNNLQGEDWSELEKQIQDGLRGGVVHYPGTAIPGQIGNVFITGHSSYYPWDKGQYKEVFALLPQLEKGDFYYVYYNQKKYSYHITEKKEVMPSNVQVLNQPDNERVSTLMTCVPVGTAIRRLILVGEQI